MSNASVHYAFSAPGASSMQAESLLDEVLKLAQNETFFAVDLTLKIVGPDDIGLEQPQFPAQFFRHLSPIQRMGFNAWITRDLAMNVSLFRYPLFRTKQVPWFSMQHVGIPCELSDELYIDRHLAVIALLDSIKKIGMPIKVQDDTGFWDHRSTFKMLEVKRALADLTSHKHMIG